MNTLDRYIVRQFLLNFVIILVVLSTLFVVVNVILDLDDFIEAGQAAGAAAGVGTGTFGATLGTLWTIFEFNGPLLFLLYVYFSGIVVVAAMAFTFTQLSRTGELVAMLASGISMYRVAAWVVGVGFILNALSLPIQELIIPALATKIMRGKSQAKLNSIEPFQIDFAPDRTGSLFSAGSFDASTNTMTTVTVLLRNQKGLAQTRVSADSAVWEVTTPEGSGWKLTHGVAKRREMAITGGAGPDATQASDEIDFIPSSLSPQVLIARQASFYPRLLSLSDLEKLLTLDTVDKRVIIEIMNTRFSLLIMNMLILARALPYFLLREPANPLIQAIKGAAMTLSLWGGGMILLKIGGEQLNPVAAAWMPVVLYLPLATYMLGKIKT